MAATAAHLVDHVIPEVPVRQWVLSVPPPVRYLLAYDAQLCGEVHRVLVGAIFGWLRRTAKRELSLRRLGEAHPGAVCVLQRFGSALNLNPHLHVLATDGVFVERADGARPSFHALPAPSRGDIAQVAWTVCQEVVALLRERGQWVDADPGDADRLAQDEPLLATLYAGSIAGTLIMGENAGKRPMRLFGAAARDDEAGHDDAPPRNAYGFDLDAAVRIPARERARLERLCRYVARPPIANDRVERRSGGKYSVRLKRPWRDGTTHLLLPGVELVAKLAALIPPPRVHQTRHYGVFAPHAKLRPQVIPEAAPKQHGHPGHPPQAGGARGADSNGRKYDWARLLKRVFEIDVLVCPKCQSRMQRIAFITDPKVIRAILTSIGHAQGPPEAEPSSSPQTGTPQAQQRALPFTQQ
jgi:hypothetical protein